MRAGERARSQLPPPVWLPRRRGEGERREGTLKLGGGASAGRARRGEEREEATHARSLQKVIAFAAAAALRPWEERQQRRIRSLASACPLPLPSPGPLP
eukprot:scaffold8063_cov27-Tisochrysis_lutea.AAC.1